MSEQEDLKKSDNIILTLCLDYVVRVFICCFVFAQGCIIVSYLDAQMCSFVSANFLFYLPLDVGAVSYLYRLKKEELLWSRRGLGLKKEFDGSIG